jgi:hypothetical protein
LISLDRSELKCLQCLCRPSTCSRNRWTSSSFCLALCYSTPILHNACEASVDSVLVVDGTSFNSRGSFASPCPQDPITNANGSCICTPCLRFLIEYLSLCSRCLRSTRSLLAFPCPTRMKSSMKTSVEPTGRKRGLLESGGRSVSLLSTSCGLASTG